MTVQRLRSLLAMLTLSLGILFGSMVHATEVAGSPIPTRQTAWLHPDGDADQVAADADKAVPHHHNSCNGHDVAADLTAAGVICSSRQPAGQGANRGTALVEALPERSIRPPIA